MFLYTCFHISFQKGRSPYNHWAHGLNHSIPHVVINLLGRFESEIGESYHVMPFPSSTLPDLHAWKWVERVLDRFQKYGITSRYMFRNQDGRKIKAKVMESKFHDCLDLIKSKRPVLIPLDLEVTEEYGIFRSFRWGGTSEATNKAATSDIVELNGRWRKKHQGGASRANITITIWERYIEVRLVLNQFLTFSKHFSEYHFKSTQALYYQVRLNVELKEFRMGGQIQPTPSLVQRGYCHFCCLIAVSSKSTQKYWN